MAYGTAGIAIALTLYWQGLLPSRCLRCLGQCLVFDANPVNEERRVGDRGYTLFPLSSACALTPSCIEVDCAVGDRDAESGANCPWHQPDFAAVCANQLRCNGQPEPGSAGPRALKRLEQVGASLFRYARTSIGHLDHGDAAFAPAGDPDLIACRVTGTARLGR